MKRLPLWRAWLEGGRELAQDAAAAALTAPLRVLFVAITRAAKVAKALRRPPEPAAAPA